ncbi:peroxiredoxin-2E-1, chloroplastic-like [Zingiber officinale]|uniref:Glutaredoxin-dependent peroxiredoxin n=1 Tax=Zingiber officinale TaxID=94328 RepID=A0A8J5I2Q6_ZINOF|nr:peroxiredoxin-2E-1, chloroplastic-like [Zingiber officinale]KAG6528862.1 hypothetical protein ZIOFF_011054 [Zingiber officinale]
MAASLSAVKLVAPSALPSSLPRLLPSAARCHRSVSTTTLHLRLHTRRSSLFPRLFASSASAPAVATTISVGDNLPDANLSYFGSDGELQTVTVSDLTKGKKAIFFAVPGAFTPTCSQKHLPGFVEKAGELRAKGVDTIACISVNDAFVMRAWKKDLNIGDEVLLLSDGNGEFTRALGVELDLSDKPVGLGVRSRRYALLAEDGVVKVLNLEDGGAFTFSGAEDLLKVL